MNTGQSVGKKKKAAKKGSFPVFPQIGINIRLR